MAETVVKTVENVDRLFSQIVVNGEVYESENYVAPTPSQSTPQTQHAVTPEPEPSSEPASTQGEDIYGVDLNDVLHNFVDNTVPDKIQQAVESLDVPSSGGSGKYIKSISQTDGKIVATEGNITDSVTSGSTDPVTGGAVASALAVPTDAVLHYSFDDLPDYPDGTATEKYLNGSTYNVPFTGNGTVTTDAYVAGDNKIHKSNVNGNANYKSDVSTSTTRGVYRSLVSYGGQIVIAEIIAKTSNLQVRISYKVNSGDPDSIIYPIGQTVGIGRHRIVIYVPSNYNKYTLTMYANNVGDGYLEWELTGWYIGYGSYATPIIDNANGQNNAINNGGLAVKGVSGKGLLGLGKKHIVTNSTFPKPTDKSSITLSIWVKYTDSYNDTGTRNLFGIGSYNGAFCIYQNYFTSQNSMRVTAYVRQDDTHLRSIGVNVTRNKWHNAVMVWENKTITFYVDGKKYTISALDISDFTFGGSYWRIGDTGLVQGNEPSVVGTIEYYVDDILIFDRALSETEVVALYLNKANTPKFYDLNNYGLRDIQPSFGCPRGGAYTLNRLTKQSIGKLNIYAGSVTFGADASGGNMYLNIDGLINTNADACFSQWTIRDVNSGYLDLSASTSIWVRIGIASATYLQTADCAGKTMDFILITKTK